MSSSARVHPDNISTDPTRGHTEGVASPVRPELSARQSDTVDRLCLAAEAEVEELGFEELTVRNVAKRAGVAPATAYNYFTSKEHLITEVFWRRLRTQSAGQYRDGADAAERVGATLQALSLLVADAPRLAAACTAALLTNSPEVRAMRDRIGLEWRRRLQDALGDEGDLLTLTTLEYVISGALVHAGTVDLDYSALPARLSAMARRICGSQAVSPDQTYQEKQ
jgi:AcrR family transcriptional regulator